MNLRRLTMKTTRFALSALAAAAILSVTASAQLTLDEFSGKAYVKTLKTADSSDTHIEALPAGSPLGAARQTIFVNGGSPYGLSSTLDIGNGICIVETGFQSNTGLEIFYGTTIKGVETPMGLNLGSYSALQLNFAGLASAEGLDVIVEVWPSSGGYYTAEAVLTPTVNAFPVVFPYTSFTGSNGGVLTQAEASDINYIIIEAEGAGSTESYGITSFQAVN